MSGIPAKTVLLIDVNSHSRSARARTLREMGMMVDCAATTSAGLSRLDAGAYSLVLVDVTRDRGAAERLVAQIKVMNPRQLVAFLVGSPPFVVKSLDGVVGATVVAPQFKTAPVVSSSREHRPAATPVSINFGRRVREIQREKEEVA
jgi:CheY-like chemotaxis protein